MTVFWDVTPCSDEYHPDDGGSKHLWNIRKLLPDYTAQHSRRQSSSYSPPWEPKISAVSLHTDHWTIYLGPLIHALYKLLWRLYMDWSIERKVGVIRCSQNYLLFIVAICSPRCITVQRGSEMEHWYALLNSYQRFTIEDVWSKSTCQKFTFLLTDVLLVEHKRAVWLCKNPERIYNLVHLSITSLTTILYNA
jgi:hypothetical protein